MHLKIERILKAMDYSFSELVKHLALPILILDSAIPLSKYCHLDLSISNVDLNTVEITDPNACQDYIDSVCNQNNAAVAYGGYLEKRNIYGDKSGFTKSSGIRNIHLGVDFWANAGTIVSTPLKGEVHSFQNNTTIGDYGPTIILQHQIRGVVFHTLYGHLSIASIEAIQIGQVFESGSALATLGTADINVNYAPHLHFQIIIDMEGMKGDYPGVSSEDRLEFYKSNCPDPNLLLRL